MDTHEIFIPRNLAEIATASRLKEVEGFNAKKEEKQKCVKLLLKQMVI